MHDEPVKRFLACLERAFEGDASVYLVLVVENERPDEPWQAHDRPFAAAVGVEVTF